LPPGETGEAGQVSPDGAPSSFVIVPRPWASERTAPETPERLTTKVSLGSGVMSPLTTTVTVFVLSPGAKLSTPEPDA
jgi:hypothetical protein